jgi:hypothetical protein
MFTIPQEEVAKSRVFNVITGQHEDVRIARLVKEQIADAREGLESPVDFESELSPLGRHKYFREEFVMTPDRNHHRKIGSVVVRKMDGKVEQINMTSDAPEYSESHVMSVLIDFTRDFSQKVGCKGKFRVYLTPIESLQSYGQALSQRCCKSYICDTGLVVVKMPKIKENGRASSVQWLREKHEALPDVSEAVRRAHTPEPTPNTPNTAGCTLKVKMGVGRDLVEQVVVEADSLPQKEKTKFVEELSGRRLTDEKARTFLKSLSKYKDRLECDTSEIVDVPYEVVQEKETVQHVLTEEVNDIDDASSDEGDQRDAAGLGIMTFLASHDNLSSLDEAEITLRAGKKVPNGVVSNRGVTDRTVAVNSSSSEESSEYDA